MVVTKHTDNSALKPLLNGTVPMTEAGQHHLLNLQSASSLLSIYIVLTTRILVRKPLKWLSSRLF